MNLAVVKQLSLQIRRTEDREKKGLHGSWRREFCRKYVALLTASRQKSYQSLVDSLSLERKEISCKRGCAYCCYHYVTVSLAQGIAIVDYLYSRKDLLKQFLDNYADWRNKGGTIADGIDGIRLRALASSVPIDRVIADTRPLSTRYFEAVIPCPFLADNTCSIYEVRPTSCSGHHAVSPPDWCAPGSRRNPDIRRSMPDDEDFIKMVQLADSRISLYELTLPTLIYRLLTEGSAAIMAELVQYDF